ncbi:AraC family transcriptional regulator [Desulfoluna butyratoxydans]|uniref:Dna binding hth domain arac-type n=1 Tax=Desulfoluna butyratoxydans TaxID=231438 RepID=A0A4V6IKW3_9BACT|nr:AraC family transcriptional regulator [Desulfoluna butyratoxydans]VFQ42618.1 dna binding hth domain arac-type [Desulfoluna butyratoxydans]
MTRRNTHISLSPPEQHHTSEKEPALPEGMTLQRVKLRRGLDLILVEGKPLQPGSLTMETGEVPFEFSFHLSGHTHYTVNHDKGELCFTGHPGLGVASAFPRSQATMTFAADLPIRMVALHVTPAFFRDYLEAPGETPGYPEFDQAMDQGSFPHCFKTIPADPAMTVAASQLLHCPYKGVGKKMFYESRALDLIAMQLDASAPPSFGKGAAPFTPKELDRIQKARTHLSRNLENPPTLAELAKTAGMNHTKLNRGFKEVYGTTVFGYLRRYRLNRSRTLIESGEMNLCEIAYATGFSSPSHFAKAFLNHFGIQPSLYLKQVMARQTISLPQGPQP